jgi:hypothetical protein
MAAIRPRSRSARRSGWITSRAARTACRWRGWRRRRRRWIGEPRSFAFEIKRLAQRQDKKIVQVFSLRGQQRREHRMRRIGLGDVVRDQPLQEGDSIRAGDLEHAARGQRRVKRAIHGYLLAG